MASFIFMLLSGFTLLLFFVSQVYAQTIVCYVTNWSQYRPDVGVFSFKNLPPLCSHVVFAFAEFHPNSSRIKLREWNDDLTLRTLRRKFPESPPFLLLAIGGWNLASEGFSAASSSASSRAIFIHSVIKLLRQFDLDGLDLDWEYPVLRGGKPADKDNLSLLLSEMYQAFITESNESQKARLLITAALAANPKTIKISYNKDIHRYLDFASIMAYDFWGAWENVTGINAPLFTGLNGRNIFSVAESVDTWIKYGFPVEKLVLGIPTYGRSFSLCSSSHNKINSPACGPGKAGNYTREPGFLAYYELCHFKSNSKWHLPELSPSLSHGDQWVTYDDIISVRYKSIYARSKNLTGIMFWALDLDDFNGICNGGTYPLIRAGIQFFKNYKPI